MNLGQYIATLRYERFTQKELAEKCGVSWNTIARIESRHGPVSYARQRVEKTSIPKLPSDKLLKKLIKCLCRSRAEENMLVELWLKERFGKKFKVRQ